MKKLLLIISMMLITSMAVCAEGSALDPVNVTLSEEVPVSFIWSIPSSPVSVLENEEFTVGVSEAHLPVGKQVDVKILINSDYLKDENEGSGREVFIYDNTTKIETNASILTVKSGYGANSNETGNFKTFEIKKGTLPLFQHSGTYNMVLVFEASIEDIPNTVTNS